MKYLIEVGFNGTTKHLYFNQPGARDEVLTRLLVWLENTTDWVSFKDDLGQQIVLTTPPDYILALDMEHLVKASVAHNINQTKAQIASQEAVNKLPEVQAMARQQMLMNTQPAHPQSPSLFR